MKYNSFSFLIGLIFFSAVAVLMLSSCQERKFQKSIVGGWEVNSMTEDSTNLLDYFVQDTFFVPGCLLAAELRIKSSLNIEFFKNKSLIITEKRNFESIDTVASIPGCAPVIIVKDTVIEYKGTWETAGVSNLALIYGNVVDNIRITERTENNMVWEKDLNVNGGIVSFSGVRKYSVSRK